MKKGFIVLLLGFTVLLLTACSSQPTSSDQPKTARYGDEIEVKTKINDDTIKANIDTDLPSGMLFEISAKSDDGTSLEKQTGKVGTFGGIKGTFKNVKPGKYTLTYTTLSLDKQSEKIQEKIKDADKTFDGQFIKNDMLNKVETVSVLESDDTSSKDTDRSSFKIESEQGSKKYPAKSGEILYTKGNVDVTGQKYYFSGNIIQKLQVDGEPAWLVKNQNGYVMPVFAEDFESGVGDKADIWGTLTGDGYQSSDFSVDNVVGMTGAMRITQLNINGKEIQ
ncbi:hypothetical protein QJV38_07180 [Listeria cossartiae subsp. cayugensis]|uniref:Lipoprotein n=1 Tax=Listeria cossartiae subsp. cayugensis TaxID=2713505 RepID=A0ABU2IIR1_9LIST|nr:hypothetical protein [Listeria cossartiae]MDT0064573.1 hypothetical protein [Listeria cossartiae subsp. cayugensis]MDT0079823.1 hypothetical protein [Listeria cossartiae subsp. cayugensis]MDT0082659.1 hypothetical protein [Listeria cossartiae subsp. cayugensis]MDT0086806.1 hypothetical protein [Listeria cossartiae subsp. cayugensis]MDT0099276.1 hypothetical protein [Listeria cossartiae subsp. cayugensis]